MYAAEEEDRDKGLPTIAAIGKYEFHTLRVLLILTRLDKSDFSLFVRADSKLNEIRILEACLYMFRACHTDPLWFQVRVSEVM